MAIGLNLGAKTAQALKKKVTTFNSPNVEGLKIINTRYFDNSTSALNPKIESHQFWNKNGIYARFEGKKFENGDRFELYKTPEEEIKLIKTRFGDIKAFKSSVPAHNKAPQIIAEKIKDVFASLNHSFLQ